ncbi:hypothetical protein [Acinetobacter colistiniresistens]|uniref:hypothetical protein n=1 Tax=Acinetobacter colistiniresistens TaxID=280145 RepID=UPI000DD07CCC|nr:hypothetical protein [Acinetobacter colistiniresistens]
MNNLLLKCGWLLTLGWLIFVGLLINKYKFPADLNSIGDFIAGMASPLAFLWVVIGYYQSQEALKLQAKELMQSTEALVNQAEMRNTTKLQEEQLKEMRVQYESALVDFRHKSKNVQFI